MSADKRVYVVKNIGRVPIKYDDGTEGPIKEYITKMGDDGVPRIMGFSQEWARQVASVMNFDIEEAVIVCPDDIVVSLHESARRLPVSQPPALQQMSEGMQTM